MYDKSSVAAIGACCCVFACVPQNVFMVCVALAAPTQLSNAERTGQNRSESVGLGPPATPNLNSVDIFY